MPCMHESGSHACTSKTKNKNKKKIWFFNRSHTPGTSLPHLLPSLSHSRPRFLRPSFFALPLCLCSREWTTYMDMYTTLEGRTVALSFCLLDPNMGPSVMDCSIVDSDYGRSSFVLSCCLFFFFLLVSHIISYHTVSYPSWPSISPLAFPPSSSLPLPSCPQFVLGY